LIFSLKESQNPHRNPKVRFMTKFQKDEFTIRDGKINFTGGPIVPVRFTNAGSWPAVNASDEAPMNPIVMGGSTEPLDWTEPKRVG
jgi:hypothetical protein